MRISEGGKEEGSDSTDGDSEGKGKEREEDYVGVHTDKRVAESS